MAISKQIIEILEQLRSMNLEKEEYENIKSLLRKIGKIALMGVDIQKGGLIYRTRTEFDSKPFLYEKDISFIKEVKNIEPNRGNFKGGQAFYGTIPYDMSEQNQTGCRMLSINEASKINWENEDDDTEEFATTGKWRIKKDFTIAAIAYHSDFIDTNDKLKEMQSEYKNIISKFPQKVDDFIAISEFLASEFGKPVGKNEKYKYKISSAFCDIMYGEQNEAD